MHETIANSRADFNRKLATELCSKYDAVCIETLSLKGMSRALKLGKSHELNPCPPRFPCQLSMGLTQLERGSVWNTMPAHYHERRMEVYFYFDIPSDQTLFQFMGEPRQTRHVAMHNW